MRELQTNYDIQAKNVMVIDQNGIQKGIFQIKTAIYNANQAGYDLVCVAPDAPTPVCRYMDYGKYKYNAEKQAKENKRKAINQRTAELQITYTTAEHDLQTKANAAKRLMQKGCDVRIVLRLRGREADMMEEAKAKVNHFAELCDDFASVKKPIDVLERDIMIILTPKKA